LAAACRSGRGFEGLALGRVSFFEVTNVNFDLKKTDFFRLECGDLWIQLLPKMLEVENCSESEVSELLFDLVKSKALPAEVNQFCINIKFFLQMKNVDQEIFLTHNARNNFNKFFQGLLELLELVKNVGLKVNLLLLNEDEILKEKALHLFENEVIFFTI